MTTAREIISRAYKAFEDAFYKGDAETISRMYTEDAELLVPEMPVVKGRAAIGEVWSMILGPGGNRVRVDVQEVEENSGWAYDLGTFQATSPNGNTLNAGKYIVIWKRQPSGELKIHRDIFNWDIPPAQTSTA
jgi:ketosteroid isomerase-like protein